MAKKTDPDVREREERAEAEGRQVWSVYPAADDEGWRVAVRGREYRRIFPTQDLAVRYARHRARQYAVGMNRSQVILAGEDGLFRAEWTYPRGSDPRDSEG